MGHSFGGGIALQLATDRPDLVRSLALVNSGGGARAPAVPHLGLGLFIVRLVAELHGGEARAVNLPDGAGVEFRASRTVAFNIDVRGFIRGRTDGDAATQPEFTDGQGRTTNTSGGALVTAGMTFYF